MTEWSPIRSVIITTLYNDPVFNKGSYTMAAKPIKTVELHYTIIQFLIIYRIQRCAKIAFKLHCSRSPKLTTNNTTRHYSCTSLQLTTLSDLFLLNINFTFGLSFSLSLVLDGKFKRSMPVISLSSTGKYTLFNFWCVASLYVFTSCE